MGDRSTGLVRDTCSIPEQPLNGPIYMSDLTVDPSTITFSKHIGDSFTLDEFYDIDMFTLEPQYTELGIEEIEPPQSPTENRKMDDVDNEPESEDETCPARGHKRKLDDLDDHSNDSDGDTEAIKTEILSRRRRRKVGDGDSEHDDALTGSEPESEDTEDATSKPKRKISNTDRGTESDDTDSAATISKPDIDDAGSASESEDIEGDKDQPHDIGTLVSSEFNSIIIISPESEDTESDRDTGKKYWEII